MQVWKKIILPSRISPIKIDDTLPYGGVKENYIALMYFTL